LVGETAVGPTVAAGGSSTSPESGVSTRLSAREQPTIKIDNPNITITNFAFTNESPSTSTNKFDI